MNPKLISLNKASYRSVVNFLYSPRGKTKTRFISGKIEFLSVPYPKSIFIDLKIEGIKLPIMMLKTIISPKVKIITVI